MKATPSRSDEQYAGQSAQSQTADGAQDPGLESADLGFENVEDLDAEGDQVLGGQGHGPNPKNR
jgi:hypothetical protein